MSSNEMDSALSRAYALVEDGKLDEARAILEPILATDRNNADAWWVYAHAVETPQEGRNALQNVLRIAPDYPGAAELMAMAQDEQTKEDARTNAVPAKPTVAPIATGQPAASAPPTLPEHPAELEEPDLEPEDMPIRQTAAPPPSRGLPIAPILAVLVIIILVVLVIASQIGGRTPPTPTQAAILVSPSAPILAATEAVTEALPTVTALVVETTPAVSASEQIAAVPTVAVTSSAAATSAITSNPQTPDDFSALRSALSQFSIAQNGIVEAPTSVGNTLLVSVCTVPGRAMRSLLPQVMNALAKQVDTLNPSIQGIGTRMINCDQNTPLLTVAVDTGSAKSYAQGKLTDAQYAALWKPQ